MEGRKGTPHLIWLHFARSDWSDKKNAAMVHVVFPLLRAARCGRQPTDFQPKEEREGGGKSEGCDLIGRVA